jgi:hypothetical protein
MAGFEEGRERPHLLLTEVLLRRIEARLMERDDPPRG